MAVAGGGALLLVLGDELGEVNQLNKRRNGALSGQKGELSLLIELVSLLLPCSKLGRVHVIGLLLQLIFLLRQPRPIGGI